MSLSNSNYLQKLTSFLKQNRAAARVKYGNSTSFLPNPSLSRSHPSSTSLSLARLTHIYPYPYTVELLFGLSASCSIFLLPFSMLRLKLQPFLPFRLLPSLWPRLLDLCSVIDYTVKLLIMNETNPLIQTPFYSRNTVSNLLSYLPLVAFLQKYILTCLLLREFPFVCSNSYRTV